MADDFDDGGPAFPVVATQPGASGDGVYGDVYSIGGMSLRDWFAGTADYMAIAMLMPRTVGQAAAMAGVAVDTYTANQPSYDALNQVRARYAYADAMIAFRNAPKPSVRR